MSFWANVFWANVFLGKRPSGLISFWANVFWANVFLGKCFSGQTPSGLTSYGQMSGDDDLRPPPPVFAMSTENIITFDDWHR
jgi:hypothetical protein